MNIKIMELNEDNLVKYDVKSFLFRMIKKSYNLGYVPEFHYDVMNIKKYYLDPLNHTFFIAIDKENDKLVGTASVRCFDNHIVKNRDYDKFNTAVLYRVFVEPNYRHFKIATNMIKKIENFCYLHNYNEIYLHTQEESYGALPFWLNRGFKILYHENDEMKTIHMEKILYSK